MATKKKSEVVLTVQCPTCKKKRDIKPTTKPFKEVTLELTLNTDEWCELANALESKARLIERGDYGEGEEEGENEAWVETLTSAYTKVTAVLDKKGVVY